MKSANWRGGRGLWLGAIVLVVAAAGSARAECPEKALPEALALRVDEPTLRQLVNVGLTYLPESLALPPYRYDIFSCGFGLSAWVGTLETDVRPQIRSYDVTLEGDALRVEAEVDLVVGGEVEAALCDIRTECRLNGVARRATISGRVRPAIDRCELRSNFEDVRIDVESDDVEVELSGCSFVPSVVDLVLWGFQSIILESVLPYLEAYVIRDLPVLIEDARLGVVLPSYSAFGVDVAVAPESVRFSGDSVQVSARAWAEPSGELAACVPEGSRLEVDPTTPATPLDVALGGEDDARVVASQDFLQQLLLSAWGAGMFCLDLDELGVDLETPLSPIFPGVELATSVRSASAPVLHLGQQGRRDVMLEVASVEADVRMTLPGDAPVRARARTGARISGRVVVDPASTSVALEPTALEVTPATVELPERTIAIRPEGLERVFDETLAPMVFGKSGRLTVVDAVFAGAPVALELTEVQAESRVLQVGLRVLPKDPDDRVPPRTAWGMTREGPVGVAVPIRAASTDDVTPPGLIRHRVSIDGVPDETIRAGQRFELLGLEPGWRRVELRAMDLNDNVGDPVALEVLVDTAPPELVLEERPIGVIHETEARWVLGARDDHSPASALTGRYRLEAVVPGQDEHVLLDEGSFVPGQPLRLRRLPEDRVLAVRFVVADEAGNEAELTTGFAVDTHPTVGCAATAGRPSWPIGLVGGVGFLALRHRRGGRRARR